MISMVSPPASWPQSSSKLISALALLNHHSVYSRPWAAVEWNMWLLEERLQFKVSNHFNQKLQSFIVLQVYIDLIQPPNLAQFKTSRLCFVTCHLAFVSFSLNNLIQCPLNTFLFSASKRFIPFLSNATRCLFTFKTSEIGCFRPLYFEMLAFWASALSCLWILNFPGLAIYYIPALNT